MREFDGFELTHFLISGQVVAHFNINFGLNLLTNDKLLLLLHKIGCIRKGQTSTSCRH